MNSEGCETCAIFRNAKTEKPLYPSSIPNTLCRIIDKAIMEVILGVMLQDKWHRKHEEDRWHLEYCWGNIFSFLDNLHQKISDVGGCVTLGTNWNNNNKYQSMYITSTDIELGFSSIETRRFVIM